MTGIGSACIEDGVCEKERRSQRGRFEDGREKRESRLTKVLTRKGRDEVNDGQRSIISMNLGEKSKEKRTCQGAEDERERGKETRRETGSVRSP